MSEQTNLGAEVASIIADLSAKKNMERATKRLKALGHRAVPCLLPFLDHPDRSMKTLAFFGLQHCWTRAARTAVIPFLADPDGELRRMAAIVLVHGEGFPALLDACEPLLTHTDSDVVAFAIDHIESERPDFHRLRHHWSNPNVRSSMVGHLPRYHDPRAGTMALEVLGQDAATPHWPKALAALIHANADDRPSRYHVAMLLRHEQPEVAELAADYLLWHGTETETGNLRDIGSPDCTAALAAIERRPPRPVVHPPLGADPPQSTPDWDRLLRDAESDGPGTLERAWTAYRFGETMEPHWAFRGRDPDPTFAKNRRDRLALQALLFAIPSRTPIIDSAVPSPTTRWAEPVLDYFQAKKSSFGLVVPDSAVEGFNGLVHMGDDVAWHRPHAAVRAVADGVVKLAGFIGTWGHLAVVEHQEPDGTVFCSLYAHLSPFLCATAGERVRAGTKLGAVGRSFTIENGGYAAHLHFAIHMGPFLQAPEPGTRIDARYDGRLRRASVVDADEQRTVIRLSTHRGRETLQMPTSWLAGYVSEDWHNAADHGWCDPRPFLAERLQWTDRQS